VGILRLQKEFSSCILTSKKPSPGKAGAFRKGGGQKKKKVIHASKGRGGLLNQVCEEMKGR